MFILYRSSVRFLRSAWARVVSADFFLAEPADEDARLVETFPIIGPELWISKTGACLRLNRLPADFQGHFGDGVVYGRFHSDKKPSAFVFVFHQRVFLAVSPQADGRPHIIHRFQMLHPKHIYRLKHQHPLAVEKSVIAQFRPSFSKASIFSVPPRAVH